MPLKQLKQIIQIKHNIVKNPNWPEADQLAIYKCGRGFELGRSMKQIQLVARGGLKPGTAGFRVRRADHSATLPPGAPLLGLAKSVYYYPVAFYRFNSIHECNTSIYKYYSTVSTISIRFLNMVRMYVLRDKVSRSGKLQLTCRDILILLRHEAQKENLDNVLS